MENDTIRVLLIEDDPVFADLLREMLADDAISQFRFRRAENLSQGLELLSQDRFDLALLDLSLPDCQGLATFARLRSQNPALPIIVLTAVEDETLAVEAVRLGAQDYLFKDRVIGKMLSRSMRYAIERQRLEQALRESEQRYKRLLDSTTDYIVTVTVEAGQAVASSHGPGCVAVTGYTAIEYAMDPLLWFRMVHEDDRHGVVEQAGKVIKGEEVPPIEHRLIHKEGSVRWVKNTPVARRNETGRVVAYDCLISDITDRKRSERRLAAQHAVTHVLAESASLTEATPRILQAVCESLGWEIGAIWRVDALAEVLRCVEVWRTPALRVPEFEALTRQSTFQRGIGLPGRIWSSGKPQWIANVVAEANFPRATVAAHEGLHGAFGFPVMVGNVVHGVVEFFSREIQQPDEDLLRMVAIIGSQVGQFIERKRTEEALAEERNLLRTLIDTLPDLIYVKDTESRFIIGNLGVAQLMGAGTPDNLIGKKDSDFYPPHLAKKYLADERAIIQSGQPLINLEEPVIDPAGKPRWMLTTKVPLRDRRGQLIGLVGVGRDITEHKWVKEERDRFFTLSLDMLCIAGFDGYFKQLNPAWERTLGFTKEELMAKPYLAFVHPADREATTVETRKLVGGMITMTFENRYLCKDGSYKWLLWSSCPFAEQKVLYAAAHDITERKQAEALMKQSNAELRRSEEALRAALSKLKKSHEELKATQLQLIQTAKMDSVGTLSAGIAHEVKNPLQIILLGVDYLSKNITTSNENMTMILVDMRNAIKRADGIIRGLLEFSASYQPEVHDEDLNAIIESSLWLVKHELIKHPISLVKALGDNLPKLKLDKNKIQQVFINVFVNAIHSMPKGGTLTIGTYARRLRDVDQDVGDRTSGYLRIGDTVQFKVGDTVVVAELEDTGTGIPEDKLPKIFDPFFTTKPSGKGTGLGLTVVKKIIELHGGTIDIRNRPQGGVKVTIFFKTWRTA